MILGLLDSSDDTTLGSGHAISTRARLCVYRHAPTRPLIGTLRGVTGALLQRTGPDDSGRVVLFLASDAAAFMAGSMVYVDGGVLLAWRPPGHGLVSLSRRRQVV